MKYLPVQFFSAAAIAGVLSIGVSVAYAAPPNPSNGYISVHDNILDKGANHGRCNAVGILASKVCVAEGELVPSIETVMDQCQAVGVDLDEDPDITPCMEEVSCEVTGEC